MTKASGSHQCTATESVLKESFKRNDISGFNFSLLSQTEKYIHTLEGILKGIVIDDQINQLELRELQSWCNDHIRIASRHPFNELIPVLVKSLQEGTLNQEIIVDMLWLCNNLHMDNQYFDIITSDIQRLEGILHGILADNIIEISELEKLRNWLNGNIHLQRIYPYEEISGIIRQVLQDGKIDQQEHDVLKVFFGKFISLPKASNIDQEQILFLKKEITIPEICAIHPQIEFSEKYFCFTGLSAKADQCKLEEIITALGGKYIDMVTEATHYLIVGEHANPCWAFSCYGRKIQRAIHLQKQGRPIILVNENDFWRAVADNS